MPDVNAQAEAAVAQISGESSNPPQPPAQKKPTEKQPPKQPYPRDSFDEALAAAEKEESTGSGESEPQGDTEEETPPWKKTKHKVKVDESEEEVDYDELVRGYQKAKASDKRFREASDKEKQVAEIIKQREGQYQPFVDVVQAIRQNPAVASIVQALVNGKDPEDAIEEMAWQRLQRQKEWEEMTPRERAMAERLANEEKRRLELEQETSSYREQRRKSSLAEAEKKAHGEIQTSILSVLKEANIERPQPWLVKMIAAQMFAHRAVGGKPDAAKALKDTHAIRDEAIGEWLTAASPEELRKRLPKKTLDGLREAMTRDVISRQTSALPDPTEAMNKPRRKRMTQDEFFNR